MKKALIGIAALVLITLSVTSCKKATAVNGGSWTFKSKTYTVTSGIADITQNPTGGTPANIDVTLSTACAASSNYGSIVFTFYTWPTVSGSYTVTANLLPDTTNHQMAINMILASNLDSFTQSNYYPSQYQASTNPVTANVTVGSNGYITIAMQPVEMVNYQVTSDSGMLAGTVKQTQPAE